MLNPSGIYPLFSFICRPFSQPSVYGFLMMDCFFLKFPSVIQFEYTAFFRCLPDGAFRKGHIQQALQFMTAGIVYRDTINQAPDRFVIFIKEVNEIIDQEIIDQLLLTPALSTQKIPACCAKRTAFRRLYKEPAPPVFRNISLIPPALHRIKLIISHFFLRAVH